MLSTRPAPLSHAPIHMFKFRTLLISVGVLAIAMCANAEDTPEIKELLQASGCLSCHSIEEKIVGPAFKSVAAKYASDADAVSTLSQSIKNGSRGKWGRMPMPPHSTLSNDDLKALASWVLTHKP
ncbi:MAG: class I cytochrome c [Comamonadaceae bacterium]|nr:MAG: class I cytochrome c [Comamonadaceae bacterium]